MGEVEAGRCPVCGKEDVPLNRKYYHYDIECQCHNPKHFEIVWHCNECEAPKEPMVTKIELKTETLKKLLSKKTLNKKLKKVLKA
jgi:hypothetical protein